MLTSITKMIKEIKWPKAFNEIERVYFNFVRESVAAH